MSISPVSNILTNQIDPLNSLAATQAPTASQTSVTSQDSAHLSKSAEFLQQLKQLETQNPAEFKKVVSQIAADLKTAAQQETNPSQSSFLNNLSDRFQKAADSGDLSSLQQGQAGQAPVGRSGHHHHHGGGGGSSQLSAQTKDTLTSIFQDAENTVAADTSSTPESN